MAEKFVATRLKPALRRASEREVLDLLKESGAYLKGLWVRLNGGGSRRKGGLLSLGLPMPTSTKRESDLVGGRVGVGELGYTAYTRALRRESGLVGGGDGGTHTGTVAWWVGGY